MNNWSRSFPQSLQWDRLERRQSEPPFKPALDHTLDTRYFDTAFTAERPRLTPVPDQILTSMDQGVFRGFSYTNPNATDWRNREGTTCARLRSLARWSLFNVTFFVLRDVDGPDGRLKNISWSHSFRVEGGWTLLWRSIRTGWVDWERLNQVIERDVISVEEEVLASDSSKSRMFLNRFRW